MIRIIANLMSEVLLVRKPYFTACGKHANREIHSLTIDSLITFFALAMTHRFFDLLKA